MSDADIYLGIHTDQASFNVADNKLKELENRAKLVSKAFDNMGDKLAKSFAQSGAGVQNPITQSMEKSLEGGLSTARKIRAELAAASREFEKASRDFEKVANQSARAQRKNPAAIPVADDRMMELAGQLNAAENRLRAARNQAGMGANDSTLAALRNTGRQAASFAEDTINSETVGSKEIKSFATYDAALDRVQRKITDIQKTGNDDIFETMWTDSGRAVKQYANNIDSTKARMESLKGQMESMLSYAGNWSTQEEQNYTRMHAAYNNMNRMLQAHNSLKTVSSNKQYGHLVNLGDLDDIYKAEGALARVKTQIGEIRQENSRDPFFSSNFAKWGLSMSGIAASLFVFQQISQWIQMAVAPMMELEKTAANFSLETGKMGKDLEAFKSLNKATMKSGMMSSEDVTKLALEYHNLGLSAADAAILVGEEIRRIEEAYEGTLTGWFNSLIGRLKVAAAELMAQRPMADKDMNPERGAETEKYLKGRRTMDEAKKMVDIQIGHNVHKRKAYNTADDELSKESEKLLTPFNTKLGQQIATTPTTILGSHEIDVAKFKDNWDAIMQVYIRDQLDMDEYMGYRDTAFKNLMRSWNKQKLGWQYDHQKAMLPNDAMKQFASRSIDVEKSVPGLVEQYEAAGLSSHDLLARIQKELGDIEKDKQRAINQFKTNIEIELLPEGLTKSYYAEIMRLESNKGKMKEDYGAYLGTLEGFDEWFKNQIGDVNEKLEQRKVDIGAEWQTKMLPDTDAAKYSSMLINLSASRDSLLKKAQAIGKTKEEFDELYTKLEGDIEKQRRRAESAFRAERAIERLPDNWIKPYQEDLTRYMYERDTEIEKMIGWGMSKEDIDATMKARLERIKKKHGEGYEMSDGFKEGMANLPAQWGSAFEMGKNLAVNAINHIENEWISFVKNGEVEWDKLVDNLMADLLKVQLRMAMMNTFFGTSYDNVFSTIASGFGFGGSSAAGAYTAPNGAHVNGTVAFGMANGGNAYPNRTYMVGERGPEVLSMGTQAGAIIPNHQLGAGMQAPEIHIHNKSGTQLETKRSETRFDMQRMVMDLWIDGVKRNVNGSAGLLGR